MYSKASLVIPQQRDGDLQRRKSPGTVTQHQMAMNDLRRNKEKILNPCVCGGGEGRETNDVINTPSEP